MLDATLPGMIWASLREEILMECDRCGREMEEGPLVSVGSRRQFQNLCRKCWTQETRNSNSRLISALNELSREDREQGSTEQAAEGKARGRPRARRGARNEERGKDTSADGYRAEDRTAEDGRERRRDPTRPQWHS